MSDFDLMSLIQRTRVEVGPDPHDIAGKVEPQIPDSELRSVLRHVLPVYVSARKERLSTITQQPAARNSGASSNRSAKVAAYQEHARFLALDVVVGPRQHKVMAACTYNDLAYAATLRREQASANLNAAEDFDELAALLRKHKSATVSKLPKEVLSSYLDARRVAT
jgi:hypothetical protein